MYKNERRITNMKEEKKIKTKEEWMDELGIDDEGDIVGEEDLEVPVDELFFYQTHRLLC